VTKEAKNMCCSNIKGSISGQYSNNKKDKLWTATYQFVYGTLCDIKINVSGKFNKGKLNGVWTINYIQKLKSKISTNSYSVNFKENIIIGKYNQPLNKLAIGGSKDEEVVSIDCNFDNNGYLDGLCQIKDFKNNLEFISTYQNGILLKYIKRNYSNGDVLEKIDSTDFVNQFKATLDTINQIATIDNKTYKLEEKRIFTDAELIVIESISFWTISSNYNRYQSDNSYIGNPINLETRGSEEAKQIIVKEIKRTKN
jgi:hypothetical protein